MPKLTTEELAQISQLPRANSMSDPSSLKTTSEEKKMQMASINLLLPKEMLNETAAVLGEFFKPFQDRLRLALEHAHAKRMETNQQYTLDIGY